MNCRLSIIIPVYNGEKFIEECVTSALAQTEKNIRIILVDDGSTDGSGMICDRLAARDERITVLHGENRGVSAARNAGLAIATGEYIGFIDADDTVRPDMFGTLLRKAEEVGAEVAVCDAETVCSGGERALDTISALPNDTLLEKSDFTPDILLETAGAVWRCIYRADLIKNHSISFPEGLKFSEDRVFNILAMGFAEKVFYLKKPFYFRRIHGESCVMRFHDDYFHHIKLAKKKTEDALDTAWGGDAEYKTAYLTQFTGGAFGAVCNICGRTSPLSVREKRVRIKEICSDGELRAALSECREKGLREKLLGLGSVPLLALAAKIQNKKHGR